MRKSILILLASLFSLCWASIPHKYTFNFSQPESLIPSVDVPPYETSVAVTDYLFQSTDGAVSIKFIPTTLGGGLGSYIDARLINGQLQHFLNMARGVQMIIRGTDVFLDSLVFSPDSYTGGLYLNSPTNIGHSSPFMNWYGDGAQNVYELYYVQNGHVPMIYGITVYYSSPQNTLKTISPIAGDTIKTTSFRRLTLKYPKKIKLTETASFTLTSNELGFRSPELTAKVNKLDSTEVIVSLADDSAFEQLGIYNLIIAENSIVTNDDEGYYNPKVVYPIKIVESYAKFNMVSVTPDTVDVEEIPNNIKIDFPGILRFRNYPSTEIIRLVNHEGTTIRRMLADYADDTYKSIKLEFQDGQTAAVKEPGLYSIVIPEGFVWNNEYAPEKPDSGIVDGARFNAEIHLEYNIGNQQYVSEEKLQEAIDYLAMKGPGYPSENSKSRKILESMVDWKLGTDEKFNDSIAAYIMETDIELPQTGKWYRLEAVSSNDGKVYLASRNDSIVLTKDIKEAVSFKATLNDDSTVVFMTMDSLYLHQLQPLDVYKGTTKRNATLEYVADVNNLTLEHLSIEGVDSLQSFGKMTIFGSLGLNLNDEEKKAYALVDVDKVSVETNWEYLPKYTETLTSAFRIVQTEKPIPSLAYTLDPVPGYTIDTLQFVKVKFLTDSLVTVAERAAATNLIGQSYTIKSTSIEPVEGEQNTFLIRFDDVPAGKSTVTIPKGTFLFVDEGRILPAEEIGAVYNVRYSMDIQYDLLEIMPFYIIGANEGLKWFRDTDLYNLIIHTNRPYVFGISDKKVNVVRIASGREDVVLTGHFENIVDFAEPGYEGCGALHLVIEQDIKEGDIVPGQYLFDIFEGTYGDVNFAKYLADPLSVSKRQCHANRAFFLDIMIDNEKAAAGIRHLTVDEQNDKVYDLSGRRMNGNVKPGLYIMNGKKVVVK